MKSYAIPLFFATFLGFPTTAFPCSTDGQTVMTHKWISLPKKIQDKFKDHPFSSQNSSPSLESQLGNLLLENKQAVISIPIQVNQSDYRPFGDGQSNAKLGLGPYWNETKFHVVGIEITSSDNSKTRTYNFHPKLGVTKYQENTLENGWIQVKPEGWNDSFYFNFDPDRISIASFLEGIPEKFRTFTELRTAPDPAKIASANPYELLKKKELGPGYNTDPWYADNVHGLFPNASGAKTAIGGVQTWGNIKREFGSFKHLYVCFEARNLEAENKFGVPSGSGWHRIGDPAESLLNSLEEKSLPVAIARTHLKKDSAYQLTEALTAVWLKPKEVLITRQGDFHWYVNPNQSEFCGEIWVHNCVPSLSNNWGFNCE